MFNKNFRDDVLGNGKVIFRDDAHKNGKVIFRDDAHKNGILRKTICFEKLKNKENLNFFLNENVKNVKIVFP